MRRPAWFGRGRSTVGVMVVMGLTLATSSPTGAQSVAPPASAGPPSPVACADLPSLLPAELGDHHALTVEVRSGVDGFEPADMLDPFLGALGRGRDDVCSVGITYGTLPTDLIGLLVRVRGASPRLAEGLAGALAERLRAYGNEVTQELLDGPTVPVTRLRIRASGSETRLLTVRMTTDTVLLTTSEALLDGLLPMAGLPSAPPGSPPAPPGSPPAPAGSPPAPAGSPPAPERTEG